MHDDERRPRVTFALPSTGKKGLLAFDSVQRSLARPPQLKERATFPRGAFSIGRVLPKKHPLNQGQRFFLQRAPSKIQKNPVQIQSWKA